MSHLPMLHGQLYFTKGLNGAHKDFQWRLPLGNDAMYNRSSIAHYPDVVR